jgi:L-threonylcarbamoyladenylate synthase
VSVVESVDGWIAEYARAWEERDPAAVVGLFTDPEARTRAAVVRLLPGGLTLILPNPTRRFPLACGPDPERLGVRVPRLEGVLAPLAAAPGPVLQSSANRSGGPDAVRLADVDEDIRRGVDLVLDGGELAGRPSTVVDLTRYEENGSHRVVREGAVAAAELAELL